MKTKIVYALMGVVSILTIARVDAATVFVPTDGDVNFLFGDLAGGVLAMFDDSDQSYAGLSLNVQLGDVVGISGLNGSGNHTATNATTNGILTLTGSDNFILGLNVGGIWFAVSSVVAVGANRYTVFFENGASVLLVDVQIIPAVPLPAAVWLFSSGMLGLVGGAVRRKARVA